MSILANLKTDSSIQEATDFIGGGRIDETGIYDCTIEHAYLEEAASGALGVTFRMKTSDGKSFDDTQWVTSGSAKGKKNYYEKDGKKHYLPGFTVVNDICLLSVAKELSEVAADLQKKVIKLYDYTTKKEVATEVNMVMPLLGQTVKLGIVKNIVDKTVKDAAGNYVPTGETRNEMVVDKVFRARDGKTRTEILAQAEEATFINSWSERNKDRVVNKSKGASAGVTTGTAMAAPSKSLFS